MGSTGPVKANQFFGELLKSDKHNEVAVPSESVNNFEPS